MDGAVRIAILTVSDGCAAGVREDRSGATVAEWALRQGYVLVEHVVIPDDAGEISDRLTAWADSGSVDLIVTTGGTGFTERDVTPEATRRVLDREAPGMAESMRAAAVPAFPSAMLSRGVTGIRGRTLIMNLPGSPGGVEDGLMVVEPVLEHAVALLRGEGTAHDP